MGISGVAASAERDPDSLEREDDSLFPACLLELFLSHISLERSPCTSSFASSSQPLTHDLSFCEAPWINQCCTHIYKKQSSVLAARRCGVILVTVAFVRNPAEKAEAFPSVQPKRRVQDSSHRSTGPSLGLYQYLFWTKSALCRSLSCQKHTQKRMRTHTGYILIQTGAYAARGGAKTSWYI